MSLISKIEALGIEYSINADGTNYRTNKHPVTMEYQDDVDVEEFRELPTYKRMCVCIMKNDHLCKYMGFSLNKTETEIRSQAEKKYKDVLNEKRK